MKNPSAAQWAQKWAFPQTKECSPPSPQLLSLLLFPVPISCSRKPQWSGLALGSRRHLKVWLGE